MRVLLSCLLILLLVPGWSGDAPLEPLGRHASVTAQPVLLDETDPKRVVAGALTFLSGVELRSADPAFGGFSSLSVQGDRFTLLSDGGNVVTFAMDGDWRIRDAAFADLPAGPRSGWQKGDRDSESMTVDPVTGDRLVGFERFNEIWRYDATLRRAKGHVAPHAMHDWWDNAGAESLVRLASGDVLVLSEANPPRTKHRMGLVFAGDPTQGAPLRFRFAYQPPRGFDPSDAAQLPNGDLVLLVRRFTTPFLFINQVVRIAAADIRADALVQGRVLATLAPPLIHDNFEGVAATREGGQTILWIVSDDNRMEPLQRTLLLKFRLDDRG